jgi:hypothetical protein
MGKTVQDEQHQLRDLDRPHLSQRLSLECISDWKRGA